MEIAEITKQAGGHKRRRRLGRGRASHGKTCGRGHKGGGSRSGWSQRGLAEGGQMPLFRRLPKRGFNNANFTTRYVGVNVGDLESRFEVGAHVTPVALAEVGLCRRVGDRIKILGDGELTKRLTVSAHRFSKRAAEKITAAGGVTEEV